MISLRHLVEHLGTSIRRCNLVSRHTTKHGVSPASRLAGLLLEEFLLVSQSLACRRVVTEEDSSVHVGRHEVHEGNHRKNNHH